MTGPAVSVVVPTRDRPGPLAACMAALERQTASSYEIVVVDDDSRDPEAVALIVAGVPCARLVRGEGRGPAAARNVGARDARAPVVCFTDDDCRPAPTWVDALTRAVSDTDAAVGPTRNGRPDDAFATASQAITNHLVASSVDPSSGRPGFAPTSNLACARSLHGRVPFDESFPLAAGEDREWCARLASAGGTLVLVPEAEVVHHQDLAWRTFWRQQQRYGRGAYRFHSTAAHRTRPRPRFYLDLVRAGFRSGARPGALVLLAQLATAAGLVQEALADRRA